jgi:ATP-dependent Clp protease ATP-binding subunit ClpC
MFDKFTEKARKVMSLAQEEARELGQIYVGTEHLLLGLIKQGDGIAAEALDSLDVTYEETLSVVKEVTRGNPDSVPGGHIPFTPRAKRVLEGAYRETIARGQTYISTEHLLLGIVREGTGIAMEVLGHMGVSGDAVRAAVNDLISDAPAQDPLRPAEVRSGDYMGEDRSGEGSMLEEFGRNLTAQAASGKLDPVIGRDLEIERIMQVLARRQKNNPLILGDPGVGKTALAEGLAQLVAAGDVPENLRNKEIWTLDVAAMVAGSKYRGEFEDRMKRTVAEVAHKKNVILFIDEMHTIIGAGSAEGSIDAASILKPPLSRGEIQVMGATTEEEYRKHIAKDAALERRFQPVTVGEPSEEETLEILEGLKDRYERHHHVRYTPEALKAAVALSSRYIQDRFLPDKAIDVIDEAGARTRVHKIVVPAELAEADSELARVRSDKDVAAKKQEFEEAARLRDEEKKLVKRRRELEESWRAELDAHVIEVTENDIAEVIASITGVPVANLTEAEASKLLRAESVLHERVIGQEEAVTSVAKAIRRSRSPLKDPRRPGGSFIFLGPSGVGKTELAKSLAEFLFGTEDALITFDMSEFMEKHAVSKLIGAPPGYVGYDDAGELTKAVRRRPYSVVLFDEIEKADPEVFNVLLQILDEGRLTDAQGRKVDFSNTVIIMTSNIGAREIATTTPMGFGANAGALSDREIKQRVMGELKRSFRPEFLNRVDEIVVFTSLSKENLRAIVDLMVAELRERLIVEGMSINLTDAARDKVAKEGTDAIYGARPLRRAIQTLIEDPLAEQLLDGQWKRGDIVLVDVVDDAIVFEKTTGEIPAPRKREHLAGPKARTNWSSSDALPSGSGGALSAT